MVQALITGRRALSARVWPTSKSRGGTMVRGERVSMKWLTAALCALTSCSGPTSSKIDVATVPTIRFDPTPGPHIRIDRISEHVWLHESSHVVTGWGRVSANGMIIVGADGALVVDSSWTERQTVWLLERVRAATGRPAIALVATHSHSDRAGGIGAAKHMNVATHALARTNELLRRGQKPAADHEFGATRTFDLGGVRVEVFYPGPGHTVDNVVVYVDRDRVLFGGCLVRSKGSTRLGYTEEADVPAWPATVTRVTRRYPRARVVVPGHGLRGGPELLTHTVELAKRGR